MKAHEIMIRDVYYVNETDTLRAVIELFIQHGISGLPIINDQKEIVAYISDGDIMRYIGRRKDIVVDSFYMVNVIQDANIPFKERLQQVLELPVMEMAEKKVIKVDEAEPIEDAAALLGNKRIKKLPVEQDGKLIGIISRGDVIRNAFKTLL
ncbi:CBS domain-containing protein [Bacillus piscicola]|uniref:CBS domain-containing protein n=1 Tax=Bacillus piscicola TaxID=1632684 RepID=UPI001F08C74E|nr:CBS domain-containing protein [Bacillus piscicola]